MANANSRRILYTFGGLIFLCFSALISVPEASSPAPATLLNLDGYTSTFEDTFSKNDVSAAGPGTTWIAHTPWHGDFGDAVFDNPGPNGPFSFGANGLEITAHKDNTGTWHSGLLASMDRDGAGQHGFAQRYGYFEMKAKLPSGSGTWPAFWLIGVNKKTSSAEIDVVEYYGGFNEYFHANEHIWQSGRDRLHLGYVHRVSPGLLSDQFNTYGVLIEPKTTSFYFNRKLIWFTPTPAEYRQPMYILVNLALGGGWPTRSLQSPVVMEVQYIRVFQSKNEP